MWLGTKERNSEGVGGEGKFSEDVPGVRPFKKITSCLRTCRKIPRGKGVRELPPPPRKEGSTECASSDAQEKEKDL